MDFELEEKTYYYMSGLFNVDNKEDGIYLAEKRGLKRLDWVTTSRAVSMIAEGIIAKDDDGEWSIYKEYYNNSKAKAER